MSNDLVTVAEHDMNEMITRAHVRFSRDEPRDERGRSAWTLFIHECNRVKEGTFCASEFNGPWWAGGTVEEYPDARVIFRDDNTVSIRAKTDEGHRVMTEAADRLNIHVTPA